MNIIQFYKSSSALFFSEEKAFEEIKDNFTIKQAIYAFLILSIITSMITGMIMYYESRSIEPLYWLVIKTIIAMTILNFLALSITIGTLHLIIKLFGAKESYSSSLKFAISAYIFPAIVISITNFIIMIIYRKTEIIKFNTTDIILISIYAIILISLSIWQLIIMGKSLAKVHEIKTSKIIGSYVILAIIGLILLGIMIGLLYAIIKSLNI
jgi:hypothetical protein